MVSVSAGGNILATYTYAARNGKLTRMTYGNGDYEDYTYDTLDRLTKVTYNGSSTNAFTVLYDSNGRPAKAVDGKAGITYLYEYDSLNRLIRAYQKDSSGNTVFAVENSYDSYGRPTGSTYVIDGTSRTYSIAYKTNTNLVSSYNTPGASFSYNYDSFDRVTSKYNPLYAYGYSYKTGTTLVSSLSIGTGISTSNQVNTAFDYTYNSLGYITNVKKNGTTIASYGYDSLGQMISESNAATGEIYIYTYDKAGNITKKDIYVGDIGNLTDTITYTYGNTAWKDRLTNYDGNAITYDSIGNPTKWVGIAALTWNGRQLTYLSEDGLDHGVAFTYNADGIRTKKVFYDYDGSVTTHNYVLDGTTIVKETVTSGTTTTTLEYYYDESGIVSVRYNGTLYHYIKNLQGDIISIVNSNNGAFVVEYTYDAWGKILSVTGTMASTLGQVNPFRYRGYYYDTETGLYYLNSRYYDAEVGRFINADGYASTGQGILGNNMFAYCNNNPIMYSDPNGDLSITACILICAGVGFVASYLGTRITGGSRSDAFISGIYGGCSSALMYVLPGSSLFIGATFNAIESITLDIKHNGENRPDEEDKDALEVITRASVSALWGAFSNSTPSYFASTSFTDDALDDILTSYPKLSPGNNPIVKKLATETINNAERVIAKEAVKETTSSLITNKLSDYTKSYIYLHMKYYKEKLFN